MKRPRGFTIVELLIVIVVIGVLATIVVVAYNGAQAKSREARAVADLDSVHKLLETYRTLNGSYPVTAEVFNPDWGTNTARTDADCPFGTQSEDWVPDVSSNLPQSGGKGKGVGDYPGCYMYTSNGEEYVLSAWNMFADPVPVADERYRRVGFRETDPWHTYAAFYLCNHSVIGGVIEGQYSATYDYYKHSYTFSNITSCNETPPSGA